MAEPVFAPLKISNVEARKARRKLSSTSAFFAIFPIVDERTPLKPVKTSPEFEPSQMMMVSCSATVMELRSLIAAYSASWLPRITLATK